MQKLPTVQELAVSIERSLRKLGGSAHYSDIEKAVIIDLGLTPDQVSLVRTGKRTELAYRLSWARTACKNRGTLANKGDGVWELISL